MERKIGIIIFECNTLMKNDNVVHVYLHLADDCSHKFLFEIKHLGDKIMSAISDFAAQQAVYNDQLNVAIDGLSSDIQALNDLISKLQNTPGVITPEDQALLDSLQEKSKIAADKLSALDALTPPVVPPVPPVA